MPRPAGEQPNFQPLIDAWGGVSLVYRRSMKDSPAYRLNHEEDHQVLRGRRALHREGVAGGLRARRVRRVERGCVRERRRGGRHVDAAGALVVRGRGHAPNIISERETPGTFKVDTKAKAFKAFRAERGADGKLNLEPPNGDHPGFFTSYNRAGKLVSFYGDNHPTYAGTVVRAMASAKDGYPHVAELFRDEIAGQRAAEHPGRDGAWRRSARTWTSELRP